MWKIIFIVELLVNACIAFTGFYIISKIIHSTRFSSYAVKSLIIGLATGLLGVVLMFKGIQVNDSLRMDLRHLPLVLLAFYGNRFPLVVATLIIAGSRFLFGVTPQAFIAFVAIIAISTGMIWIHRQLLNRPFRQNLALNVWALLMITFTVLINLGFNDASLRLLLATWTIGLAVGVLSSMLTLDFQTLNRQVELYKQSSERDHLTGLYNRRVWDTRTAGLEQEGRIYNVLALDIDHFKHVNDTYGHGNGDLVLQQFANILMEETRPHDITARIGGEEFMILIYDLTPPKIIKVANRIRERIAHERFQLDGFPDITVTASIGIAHGKQIHIQHMNGLADEALYTAKQQGRNRTILFNQLDQQSIAASHSSTETRI
ncbi:diguanylate cyclase [Exiguobacterium sp. K1]|uniref:GGDEF domain-containing protein n=1 Tax=Exiguobacterium sp. K1 TaxID=2980105 RepID=UPI00299EED01|nr:diguanylate cyclase [Exiguobacterium sp. K1]MDX1259107.1 diguanylate cyclase [Exiguobacterium sp. K1]